MRAKSSASIRVHQRRGDVRPAAPRAATHRAAPTRSSARFRRCRVVRRPPQPPRPCGPPCPAGGACRPADNVGSASSVSHPPLTQVGRPDTSHGSSGHCREPRSAAAGNPSNTAVPIKVRRSRRGLPRPGARCDRRRGAASAGAWRSSRSRGRSRRSATATTPCPRTARALHGSSLPRHQPSGHSVASSRRSAGSSAECSSSRSGAIATSCGEDLVGWSLLRRFSGSPSPCSIRGSGCRRWPQRGRG